jgi:hypothetical protein
VPPVIASIIVVAAIAAAAAVILIWTRRSKVRQWIAARRPGAPADNGLSVGAPKVYDTRTLVLLLDQLREQLRTLRTIDQERLARTAGSTQARRANEHEWKAAVGAPDETKDASSKETGAKPGESAGDAEALNASAFDVLADQIALSYEIFNLEMLLERALSDRVHDGAPRRQAVLGFTLSVQPPWCATNCAARAAFNVRDKAGRPISLVALFPQERADTVIAQNRRKWGGAAGGALHSVKVLAAGSHRKESSAIQRDPEMFAFEDRGSTAGDGPTFGWQLRPARGRKSVTPGLRQVFAILALPSDDRIDSTDDQEVSVQTVTSWRRYRPRTQTVTDSPGWRWWFTGRSVDALSAAESVAVPSTANLQAQLSPKIDAITWRRTGANTATVMINGQNLFAGTSVIIGGRLLDSRSPELMIHSDQKLTMLVPMSALLTCQAVLNGRYGGSVALEKRPPVASMRIRSARLDELDAPGIAAITLELAARKPVDWGRFVKLDSPLLTVDGRLIDNTPMFNRGSDDKTVLYSTYAPLSVVPGKHYMLVLRFPFAGAEWAMDYVAVVPDMKVTRAGGDADTVLLIAGAELDNERCEIALDEKYSITADGPLQRVSRELLRLKVSTSVVAKYGQLLLLRPDRPAVALSIPPAPEGEPRLNDAEKPLCIDRGSTSVIELTGERLDLVTSATVQDVKLDYAAGAGGRSLAVYVTAAATSKPGKCMLTLETGSGKSLATPLFVIGALAAAAAQGDAGAAPAQP